jgi:hypothetical protein
MGSSSEPQFAPLFDEDEPPLPPGAPALPPVETTVESSFAPPVIDEVPGMPPLPEFAPTSTVAVPTAAIEFTPAPAEPEPAEEITPSAAEFPFHVRIEGPLTVHEKEKLLALLGAEDFGVRAVDIEPQLDSGCVLLPRMSRYATAYLLQNLPLTQAVARVQPLEEAFAEAAPLAPVHSLNHDAKHPADDLPLTQGDALPQLGRVEIFDCLTSALTAPLNQADDGFARLKRKLRFLAHARGAEGIVHYHQETGTTLDAGFVRLSVTGDLVRTRRP